MALRKPTVSESIIASAGALIAIGQMFGFTLPNAARSDENQTAIEFCSDQLRDEAANRIYWRDKYLVCSGGD